MKKTYTNPKTILTVINCERLISTSLTVNSDVTVDQMYVKGDNSAASQSDYNVWSDDWSK